MTTLDLPAMPVNADHDSFVAECQSAISILATMETRTTADLDNARAKDLTKAVAALVADLPLIQQRKKEIGIAKCDAIIRAQTAMADKYDQSAAVLRPAFEAAKAAFDAAKAELATAQEALRWDESRAELARSAMAAARREREWFDPAPVPYRPATQPGQMERTAEQELALLRPR